MTECTHPSTHIEMVEQHPGSVHEVPVYVCDDCDATVDGDPAADQADAITDMQVDEMRDK